jgi:hypothetical protein
VDAVEVLKELNERVKAMQEDAFARAAAGEDVRGWVVVGRGMRYLRGAQVIEGRTVEDVRWETVGQPRKMGAFLLKTILLGVLLTILRECICTGR